MKAIEAWNGCRIRGGRNAHLVISAHTRSGDTWAYVTGRGGKAERVSLIRATPEPGTEGTTPTGDEFIAHVTRIYGPYKGSTASTIRQYVRDNPLCGCQWVQSRQSLAVAIDERVEV